MSAQSNQTQPIPQEEEDSFTVFRGYTVKDALLFAPAGLVFIVSAVFTPEIIARLPIGINQYVLLGPGIGVSVLLALIGVVTLLTTPSHYTPREWALLHLRHRFRANEVIHQEEAHDHENRDTTEEQDMGFVASAIGATQRTQDVTNVEEVLPSSYSDNAGVVRLTNGDVASAVKVEPTNLSLATAQQWSRVVGELTSIANTIDHPIKICHTTRDFDVGEYLEPFSQRLSDEDVRSSPVLDALLRDFLEWYPRELELQGTKQSEFYVVVGVSEAEVTSTARSESVTDQLADTPGFSLIFSSTDEELHESVIRGRQREQLYRRVESIEQQVRKIEGVEGSVLPAEDHAALIAESWQRTEYEPGGELEPTPMGTKLTDE